MLALAAFIVWAISSGGGAELSAAQRFAELMDVDWFVNGHIPLEAGFERPNSRRLIVDCCGEPAGYALLPASRPLDAEEFAAGAHHLALD